MEEKIAQKFILLPILFCHRTEGSHEIALRLRELCVLPPLKANGKVFSPSDNSLLEMGEDSTGVNTQEQKRSIEDPGKKRKRDTLYDRQHRSTCNGEWSQKWRLSWLCYITGYAAHDDSYARSIC